MEFPGVSYLANLNVFNAVKSQQLIHILINFLSTLLNNEKEINNIIYMYRATFRSTLQYVE